MQVSLANFSTRLIRLGYFYGYSLWFLSQMMTIIGIFRLLDCLIQSFDWSDVKKFYLCYHQ